MKKGLIVSSAMLSLAVSLPIVSAATLSTPSYPTYSKSANITWWTWTSNPKNVIADFNKKYPNIHVTVHDLGSGSKEYTKLQTAIKSGSGAPDVVQIEYQMLPQFIGTGGLQDISKYVGFAKSSFPAWTWNEVSQGSKVYAIPEDIGPMALFYRPDVFKKYGLTPPTTWQQYATDAATLHQKDPNMYYSFLPVNDPGVITGLLWQGGAQLFKKQGDTWVVSINSAKAKSIMNFWGKLIKQGVIKVDNDSTPQWQSEIGAGKYATALGAVWYPTYDIAPYVKSGTNDWNAADIPQSSATGTFVDGNWGGSTNAVTKQSKFPQAAAIFAAFINTDPSEVELAAKQGSQGGRGLYPADKNASSLPELNAPLSDLAGQNPQSIYSKAASSVDTSFEWSPWTDYVYNEMTTEFTQAANGKESWDQALDNVEQKTLTFAKSQGYKVVSGAASSNSGTANGTSSQSQSTGSKSPMGAIIGVIVAIIVIGGGFLLIRRRRRK